MGATLCLSGTGVRRVNGWQSPRSVWKCISDASGAIHLSNEAGAVNAQQVHETLMVLLHSNFATVSTTSDWVNAVRAGEALPQGDLGSSAVQGGQVFAPVS